MLELELIDGAPDLVVLTTHPLDATATTGQCSRQLCTNQLLLGGQTIRSPAKLLYGGFRRTKGGMQASGYGGADLQSNQDFIGHNLLRCKNV
ncbi:hypothetical protein D3C77_163010 [compost metagenome]